MMDYTASMQYIAPMSSDLLADPVNDEHAFARFLTFLAIPSVSALPVHASDVERAAAWVCEYMRDVPGANLEATRLPGATHPAVLGQVDASSRGDAPTIAVYAHFDVQPAGARSQWSSDPFRPAIRDGWVYGRGTADSKANCFIVLEAIKRLATARQLPVHIQLLLDGEEEIDGVGIPQLVASQPPVDAAIICDGGLEDDGTPSFSTSLRGTLYYQVKIKTAERELHSGSYGGAAMNAGSVIVQCLASAIQLRLGPGRPAPEDLERLQRGPEILRKVGATPIDEHAGAHFYQRTVLRSAIDVNSIGAGEVGLQKTAIPAEAIANVSVRVAPGEDNHQIDEAFRSRLTEQCPAGARLSIELLANVPSGETNVDSAAVHLAAAAFERRFGAPPRLVGGGGTLPLFSVYAERRVPVIATGFATADGAAHAANERFPLSHLALGVAATSDTLTALGSLPR
jgi:acetylornithine deacetylase/succinyl-diaminopimelate desuccinylase-like protein